MVSVPGWVTKCETCGNKHPYYEGDCPLIEVVKRQKNTEKLPESMFGESPSVFVGRHNYPQVNVGPTAAQEEETAVKAQDPKEWFGMPYEKVIGIQTALIRSKSRQNVRSDSRFSRENQLLSMAKRPTDVELDFKKRPKFQYNFDNIRNPVVSSGPLDQMEIAENVKIKHSVEKIVNDELKARRQAEKLYSKDMDVYQIINILSSGALGKKDRKKMVPTRWSVTASQSMVAKSIIEDLKDRPVINDYRVYSSEYLDNHFEILLIPGKWEFENFESWAPEEEWAQQMQKATVLQEHEPYDGRTSYAEAQGGGYYAARLGTVEGLKNLKKQARAVVFREVYEGYIVPVGSWQILENVRNAFRQDCRKFETREKALEHIDSNLRVPIENYIGRSEILKQKRLSDFIG
ncbi:MAG: hypothetical protein SVV03_02870 [Candidatus Nanohaloarchaea archaeon]|nr:hypothetical protein [Candidatus Nanohaloarchaea archaeon]